MSRPDFDPRGNKDVGDISEPEYGSGLTRIIEWIFDLVRWLRQREPVTPGDPFTKFATMGRLVQLGVVTEKAVLGDDEDQDTDDDAVEPEYVVVHAREMYPSATAGATGPTSAEITSAKPNIQYIEFSAVGDSSAEFQLIMPFGWPGNAFQFRCYWSHPTGATTYGVSWKLQAHSATDQEAIGSDFADGGYVDDDGGTTDTLYITPESSPITISGVNAKAGDLIFLRITRNRTGSAHDDLNVAARLHAIRFNLGEAPVEFPPPTTFTGTVLLHCTFEGADGSTTWADTSSYARTLTGGATLKLSNGQSKWGTTSLRWSADNCTFASISSSEFVLGPTEPFTVAVWVFHTTTFSVISAAHFFRWSDNGPNTEDLWNYSSTASFQYNNEVFGDEMAPNSYTTGTWTHLEVGFDGTNVYVFKNGTLVTTIARSRSSASTATFYLGGDASPTSTPDGTEVYMGEILVLKNQCLHTAGFTPPTAPYPDA